MIPRISTYIPQRLFSLDLPENKAIKIALFILADCILAWIVRSLVGRVSSYYRNKKAESYLNEGNRAISAISAIEDRQIAEQCFRQALSWEPSNPDLRAKIFLDLAFVVQDRAEAFQHVSAAIDAHPQNEALLLEAYVRRAQKYFIDKQYDEALTDLGQALPLAKKMEKFGYFALPSLVECDRDNHTQAIESCKKEMNRCLTPKQCQRILLHLAKKCKTQESAFLYLNEALALRPDKDVMHATLRVYRAYLYCFGQQFDPGLKDLEAALECEVSPKMREMLLSNQGTLQLEIGMLEFAEKELPPTDLEEKSDEIREDQAV